MKLRLELIRFSSSYTVTIHSHDYNTENVGPDDNVLALYLGDKWSYVIWDTGYPERLFIIFLNLSRQRREEKIWLLPGI
jgi:hypothetical protein